MAFIVGGIIMGATTLVSAGVSYMGQKKMQASAESQTRRQLEAQAEQQAKLDAQKEIYKSFEFTNPYENISNAFEDLTVNQQQAQFQSQQGAQQRADILQGLRGAAGTSGVAGLAQSLANQQQLQTQQISASIGQQESRNQLLAAKGATAADMAERGGEAMLQEAEMSRQATLLGVEYGGMAGANAGVQQAYANQMQSDAMANQMLGDRINMIGNSISTMAGQGMFDKQGIRPIDSGGTGSLASKSMYQGPTTKLSLGTTNPFS